MPKIAPSATVERGATLADDVEVGAGCYVGPDVSLGSGTRLMANVTVLGKTEVGSGNIFYPACVIGAAPQDLKYRGSDTRLRIGDQNVFREAVTAHTGTEVAGGVTEVGNHNQFQIGTHIAHDVHIGDHCIISNQVQIAGHCQIENHVTISGMVGIGQFVTIGRYSFITGMARCPTDTPPYTVLGYDGYIQGINVRGLGRWGFPDSEIQSLRDLSKILFPKKGQNVTRFGLRAIYGMWAGHRDDRYNGLTMAKRIQEAESNGPLNEHCLYLLEFMKRSILNGVHGRYLESLRRDSNQLANFYAAGAPGD